MSDTNDASLLGKQGMGGIHGGKGFRAQDAYLCVKLPYWFADPGFTHALNEGSGDIDLRYERAGRVERHYLQVKDHPISRSEFREVVEQFRIKHKADPELRRFIVVGGGLHDDVKAFQRALARLRGAAVMHEGSATEAATLADLQALVTDLKLPVTAGWALEHLDIEDSEHVRTWPNSAASLLNDFVGQTLSLEGFEHALRPGLVRAYQAVQAHVVNNFGVTLSREDMLDVVRRAMADFRGQTQAEGLGIFFDVWGDPDAQARLAHDAVIDWREHFDRETRLVPPVETWTQVLQPELAELQRRFRASGTNRHVTIRGQAPLSVGLAVGAAFSAVKGYRLTIEQRGALWASDAAPSAARVVAPAGLELPGGGGQGLCVELSGIRAVRRKVEEYAQASGAHFAARLALRMEGELSAWTAADAVAVAESVRRHLIAAHDEHGFDEVHLFFALPLGAAVLLGHRLNSVGVVQAYEEQFVGGYAPSCRLNLR
ncbi:SAVED domain-containing protein [Deinococcus yunweiensis]|uniref:SAVED domain-containing protein n=1 Tax=Deinococcus yunweiensis TaxID=367282 RepID=UPI00398E6046